MTPPINPTQLGEVSVSDSAAELCEQFPHSRASTEHATRLARGVDYSRFPVVETLLFPSAQLDHAHAGLEAFIRVCARVATLLDTTSSVKESSSTHDQQSANVIKAVIERMYAPFKDPNIMALLKSSKLHSLLGAFFGSDSWIGTSGTRSVEVNFGPATGGLLEQGAIQDLDSSNARTSNDGIEGIIIQGICDYYNTSCESLKIQAKPLPERHIAIIENDGYYVASFRLAAAIERLTGAKVSVIPLEAVQFNTELDRLTTTSEGYPQQVVDQVICNYYLEAAPTHPIVDALTRNRVIGASAPVVDILLGAKLVLGVCMLAVQSKNGALARYLNISDEDKKLLLEAFPRTHIHSPGYFRNLAIDAKDLAFHLRFGELRNLFAKDSSGGTYGGHDVYDFSYSSDREGFLLAVEQSVSSLLEASVRNQNMPGQQGPLIHLGKAFTVSAISCFCSHFADANNSKGQKKALDFLSTCGALVQGAKLSDQVFNATHADLMTRLAAIGSMDFQFEEPSGPSQALEEIAGQALKLLGKTGKRSLTEAIRIMRLEIGISSYLPFIYQSRIETDSTTEIRISGVCDEDGPMYFASHARTRLQDGRRAAALVSSPDLQKPFSNRHNDPASKFLELELSRDPDELVLLPKEQHFRHAAVLMSGIGRHARPLARESSLVDAIDTSQIYLSTSQSLSQQQGISNIAHINEDIFSYLAKQPDGSLDLVGIFGNSIIYLEPNRVRMLLRESYRVLQSGGILLFDVVNVDEYSPLLLNRPVSSTTNMESGDESIYRRLVVRRLVTEDQEFLRLHNLGIYIRNRSLETTHDSGYLFLPQPHAIPNLLNEAGFQEHHTSHLHSDYPVLNMMRDRLAIRAHK